MPLILIGDGARAMVVTDAAYSFGTRETLQYTRSIVDGRFVTIKGDKNAHCFYPVGQKDTA